MSLRGASDTRRSNLKLFLILVTVLLAGMLDSCPVSGRNINIAVLKSRNLTPYDQALAGFIKTLRENGYPAGMQYFNLEGEPSRGPGICAEIKSRRPDLVLTLGTEATKAISRGITDIPIVFCMVLRPVEDDLIDNFSSSGNNLTGVAIEIPAGLQFKTLKGIMPGVKRIGFIFNPARLAALAEKAEHEAGKLGLELIPFPILSPRELPKVLKKAHRRIEVLWMAVDSSVYTRKSLENILFFSLRNKLPVIGYSRTIVRAGGLFGLICDYGDIGRQAGCLAIKVLAGKKPEEIPVEVPLKQFLIINLIVADRIGLSIPVEVIKNAHEIFEQE